MAVAKVIPIMESSEAEQSVLGATLMRPELLSQVMSLIGPADFYRNAHGRIFQAMVTLSEQGNPVDLVTVSALLKEQGQLEAVGGPGFLAGLAEQVGFAVNAQYYARLIREKSQRRKLEATALEIINQCQKNGDINDLFQYADSQIFEVTKNDFFEDEVIAAKTLLAKDFLRAEEVIGNGILPQGGGLIIAGESGDGKSLLRLELAIHLSLGWDIWNLDIPRARKVLIIQFENTEPLESYRLKKMLEGLTIRDIPDNLLFSTPTTRFDLGNKKDQFRLIRRKPPSSENSGTQRTRGASSIKDWADTLLGVSKKRGETILRSIEFLKVRNGPEPKTLTLERNKENFLHKVINADDFCPPERVAAILESLGGRVEGQELLKKAIISEVDCKERRARHFISQALSRATICCETNPEDSRKRIYFVKNSGTES